MKTQLLIALGLVFFLSSHSNAQFPYTFRNGSFDETIFKLEGRLAERYVNPAEDGLRIALPDKGGPTAPVGIRLRRPLMGNFEVTVGYELLKAGSAASKRWVGISAYLMFKSPLKDGVSLARFQSDDGGQVYALLHMQEDANGKRTLKTNKGRDVLAKSGLGTFRLTRDGDTLTASVAEDATADFSVLGELQIGLDTVSLVRIAADPGGVESPVDVRLLSFNLLTTQSADQAQPPKEQSQSFQSRLGLFGVVLGIVALLVCCLVVAYKRFSH